MDFSPSAIFAGFVFGVFGIYLIKRGRNQANLPQVLIGVSLCAFPYFVSSPLLTWGIGIALLLAAYRST